MIDGGKVIKGLESSITCQNQYGDCDAAKIDCPYCGIDCHVDLMRDALALLKAQESTVDIWIGVKDRLPEDEYECLVCAAGSIEFGWYHCGVRQWFVDGCICGDGYVTHWMPLPSTEGLDAT